MSGAATTSSWALRGLFGLCGWLLFSIVASLAASTLFLAHCMAAPVRWNGPGFVGAIGLSFPLHFVAPMLVAAATATLARRGGARLSAWTCGFGVLLTATMALVPAVAIWRTAAACDVPLSLGEYLANAARLNIGSPHPELGVVYGAAADGTPLVLDAWRTGLPAEGPPRPAVLVLHGGAWTHGARSMTPDWDRWLNGCGYEVFDVEYRLPPPVRWLDEIGDVKAALGWVAAHAAEYHVDPARISLMGASAGANLALLAAYSRGDPRLPPSTGVPEVAVRSVVNLYGPVDLALLWRRCESADYVRPLLEQYVGGTPDEAPERYALLSPLSHVGADSPPTLTLLGTSDRLVSADHARLLDEALARAGVPHETCLLAASDHAFDLNWGGFATQIARAKIAAFLARE
jgi:acetyl esterase/lipase